MAGITNKLAHPPVYNVFTMSKIRLARRALLQQSAAGFGLLGLRRCWLRKSAPKSAGSEDAALSRRESNASSSCSCTADRRASTPSIPSRAWMRDNGKPVPFKRGLTFGEDAVRGLMKPPWEFQAIRTERHPGQRTVSECRAPAPTICAWSGPWWATAWTMAPPAATAHRRLLVQAARAWARGFSTAWAPRIRTCPASSPSSRRWATADRTTGAPASCPANTRAPRSATPDMKVEEIEKEPVPYLVPQRPHRRNTSATNWTCCRR